ncbi:unnamed protein product [Mytilus coruscus]|uniref:Endonuclease/exonuclease/phosphatase domain-containing protein n=1 Tax=Mytilus coruscus TaxID=42192 RepID=A0A6J8BCI3_MYTCO|nr:unnamed protein product [Mytilus coruscus]
MSENKSLSNINAEETITLLNNIFNIVSKLENRMKQIEKDFDKINIKSQLNSQAQRIDMVVKKQNNSQKKSKIDAEHYTPFLKQAKIENKVASLVRDKLYIDGALYKPNDQRREFREAASLTTVSGGVSLPILQIDRRLQTDKFNQLQVQQFHLGHLRDAFNETETEYLQLLEHNTKCGLIGDFNLKTSTVQDFISPERFVLDTFHLNDENTLKYFYNYDTIIANGISLERKSECRCRVNPYGHRLHDMCKKMNLFIANSRIGNDKNVDRRTCNDASVVDYIVSNCVFRFISINQIF